MVVVKFYDNICSSNGSLFCTSHYEVLLCANLSLTFDIANDRSCWLYPVVFNTSCTAYCIVFVCVYK